MSEYSNLKCLGSRVVVLQQPPSSSSDENSNTKKQAIHNPYAKQNKEDTSTASNSFSCHSNEGLLLVHAPLTFATEESSEESPLRITIAADDGSCRYAWLDWTSSPNENTILLAPHERPFLPQYLLQTTQTHSQSQSSKMVVQCYFNKVILQKVLHQGAHTKTLLTLDLTQTSSNLSFSTLCMLANEHRNSQDQLQQTQDQLEQMTQARNDWRQTCQQLSVDTWQAETNVLVQQFWKLQQQTLQHHKVQVQALKDQLAQAQQQQQTKTNGSRKRIPFLPDLELSPPEEAVPFSDEQAKLWAQGKDTPSESSIPIQATTTKTASDTLSSNDFKVLQQQHSQKVKERKAAKAKAAREKKLQRLQEEQEQEAQKQMDESDDDDDGDEMEESSPPKKKVKQQSNGTSKSKPTTKSSKSSTNAASKQLRRPRKSYDTSSSEEDEEDARMVIPKNKKTNKSTSSLDQNPYKHQSDLDESAKIRAALARMNDSSSSSDSD